MFINKEKILFFLAYLLTLMLTIYYSMIVKSYLLVLLFSFA